MNNLFRKDQRGITHIVMLAALAVVVVGGVTVVGLRVAGSHKTSSALTNSKGTASKTASVSASASKVSTISAAPVTSSPATTTTNTKTTATVATPKTTVTPVVTPSSPPAAPAPVTVVPPGYTNLGTISADNLYNVKVPPASNEQPTMTVYACMKTTGTKAGYVQALGVLSYPIPQADASAWFVNLDLSSSASADNIISDKSSTQSYQNSSWQNNGAPAGTVNESTTITTSGINPGVVTDYYVWAFGSYGGTAWQGVNSHPNVTGLTACN